MRPPIAALLGLVLLCSACPEEDEKNPPALTGSGAGSLPAGVPDDAGAPPLSMDTGSGTEGEGGTEADTGRASGTDTGFGTMAGSGTLGQDGTTGEDATIGATSIGEPPPVTTGILTSG